MKWLITFASPGRSYLTLSDVEFIVNQEYLDRIQAQFDIEDIYLANSLQQGFVYRHLNSDAENDAYCATAHLQNNAFLNVMFIEVPGN